MVIVFVPQDLRLWDPFHPWPCPSWLKYMGGPILTILTSVLGPDPPTLGLSPPQEVTKNPEEKDETILTKTVGLGKEHMMTSWWFFKGA